MRAWGMAVMGLCALMWCGEVSAKPAMQELKKLDQFSYGYFVVDGAVRDYEYFRATFGGAIPCGRFPVTVASPLTACEELDPTVVRGSIVLAARGECSFVDKAANAAAAGAAGVVISNLQGGMIRMPMGNNTKGEGLSIPVVMVNNATGVVIQRSVEAGLALTASLVPKAEPCLPTVLMEQWPEIDRPFSEVELRDAEEAMDTADRAHTTEAGVIGVAGTPTDTWHEMFTAEFGAPIVPSELAKVVVADPVDGCTPLRNDVTGAVTVVFRGTCPLIYKARHAQTAGASAVIIVNYETELGAVRASPDEKLDVYIPTVMISAASWATLSEVPPSTSFAWTTSTVTGKPWEDAADLAQLEASDWPETAIARRQWMAEIINLHHPRSPAGHWQRWEIVEAAAARAELTEELKAALDAEVQDEAAVADAGASLAGNFAPFLLAPNSHRVLDHDSSKATARGAHLLCASSRGDRYIFTVPEFHRSSDAMAEIKLRQILRQQQCLEKVLLENARLAGETARFMQAQLDRDAYADAIKRIWTGLGLLADQHEVMDTLTALADREQSRHLVDAEVSVADWLADPEDATEEADAEEVAVDADGEWSV